MRFLNSNLKWSIAVLAILLSSCTNTPNCSNDSPPNMFTVTRSFIDEFGSKEGRYSGGRFETRAINESILDEYDHLATWKGIGMVVDGLSKSGIRYQMVYITGIQLPKCVAIFEKHDDSIGFVKL